MQYLRLTITDTLSFWDDFLENYTFNPENSRTFTTWYRLPDEWFGDNALVVDKREVLLQHLYGETWRAGNDDGSRYQILRAESHLLNSEEVDERPWAQTGEPCYASSGQGALEKVEPSAF